MIRPCLPIILVMVVAIMIPLCACSGSLENGIFYKKLTAKPGKVSLSINLLIISKLL